MILFYLFDLCPFLWQAVAVSLYAVGFGESISSLIHQENPWVARGIASAVIILLLGKCSCSHCELGCHQHGLRIIKTFNDVYVKIASLINWAC